MPSIELVVIFVISAFVHGAFGFGFPTIATPLLVLGLDIRTAILLTLVPTVSINLFSIFHEKHWREALKVYWPIPAFTIVGSITGTQVLLSVDPAPFKLLLALVMVGYLLSDRFGRSETARKVPTWGLALFGFLLGMLAGVVNIFSPVVVAFALLTRMAPALMVATFNLAFLTSKTGQIVGFVMQDAFLFATVKLSLIALSLTLESLWLGIKVRRRIKIETYRNLLRLALWLIAFLLVVDWSRTALSS